MAYNICHLKETISQFFVFCKTCMEMGKEGQAGYLERNSRALRNGAAIIFGRRAASTGSWAGVGGSTEV